MGWNFWKWIIGAFLLPEKGFTRLFGRHLPDLMKEFNKCECQLLTEGCKFETYLRSQFNQQVRRTRRVPVGIRYVIPHRSRQYEIVRSISDPMIHTR